MIHVYLTESFTWKNNETVANNAINMNELFDKVVIAKVF